MITLGLIESAIDSNHPETAKLLFQILREIREAYEEEEEEEEI